MKIRSCVFVPKTEVIADSVWPTILAGSNSRHCMLSVIYHENIVVLQSW
jgi:hypothetical protein